jgi:CHASE3 domain sensor protein
MQLILARFVIGCLFLTLIHGASLTAVHSNRTGQNRNVLQFGYLIWGAAGNPFDYNGYGCW